MSYYSKVDHTRSQQSISYYSDLEGGDDSIIRARPRYHSQLYPHMLLEDIRNRILPIYARRRLMGNTPQVVFIPRDSKTEELITHALDGRNYPFGLGEALENFMQDCAYTLIAYQEAFYEIVYLSEPDSDIVVGFELGRVNTI